MNKNGISELMKLCHNCGKTYDRRGLFCPVCKGTAYWRISVERDTLGIIKRARVMIEEGISGKHGARNAVH